MFGDGRAQAFQVVARLGDIGTDACADLDLALQKFGADLLFQFRGAGRHQSFRRFGQVQTVAVDQKVFFLDPDRKSRCCLSHGVLPFFVS